MKIYLISALVGAVIGYITNWLAIKMLFKPHNEKRVFGIRIPFTPGLIPKEKKRIAKSIGETVSEHILTNEVIAQSLNNEKILFGLKNMVDTKVHKAFDENFSVNEVMKNLEANNAFMEEKLRKKAYTSLEKIINNKEKNVIISSNIFNCILERVKEKPQLIIKLIKSKKFKDSLLELNAKQKSNKILDKKIVNTISEKTLNFIQEEKILNDIIPDEISKGIEELIYNQKDIICENLIKALEGEIFSSKIKDIIGAILPSMVTMFMSIDSLYEKLFNSIKGYLLVEENKIIVCNYIISMLNNLKDTKIEEIIRSLSEDDFNNICKNISDLLNNKLLSDENILMCIEKFEKYMENIDSYETIILKVDENYKQHLKEFLDSSIKKLVKKEEFKDLSEGIVNNLIGYLLDLRVKDIFDNEEEMFNFVWNIISKYYNDFIEKDAHKFVELIDISGLIEEQINSFDVSYAEKLIVKIARRELGAITWLGALLGAFLGLLSPLLSRLYS